MAHGAIGRSHVDLEGLVWEYRLLAKVNLYAAKPKQRLVELALGMSSDLPRNRPRFAALQHEGPGMQLEVATVV